MDILIADGQPRVRYALSVLLQGQRDLVVVGVAADTQDLLGKVAALQPDVVLLDWDLPGLPPLDRWQPLRACGPLVIVAMSANPEIRPAALRGADFFISKVDSPPKLLETLRQCERKVGRGRQLSGAPRLYLEERGGET